MFNKKSKTKKSLRRRQESDEEEEEIEFKKVSLQVFHTEQSTKKKLLLRNNIQLKTAATSTSSLYSKELLENEIRMNKSQEQMIKAKMVEISDEEVENIPQQQAQQSHPLFSGSKTTTMDVDERRIDQITILEPEEIEKLLELKRNQQAKKEEPAYTAVKSTSKAADYISLNGIAQTHQSLTRIDSDCSMHSTDDEDSMEEFEDYKSNQLVFGENSLKMQKRRENEEKQTLFSELIQQTQDDEFIKHEFETLRMGSKQNQSLQIKQKDIVEKQKIPDPYIAISNLSILENIGLKLTELNENEVILKNNLDILNQQDEEFKFETDKITKEMKIAADKFDFFASLQEYTTDLVEFTLEKELLVSDLEQQYRQIHQHEYNQTLIMQQSLLSNQTQTVNTQSLPKTDEEVEELKLKLFDDSSKQFKKLKKVNERYFDWKLNYPESFQKAYGTQSIIPVFDLYIRYELANWKPFSIYKSLRETDFFILEDKVLEGIMKKSVVPIFIKKITYFNVFHHTEKAFKWISFLKEFFEIRDTVMQVFITNKNILDEFEDCISKTVKDIPVINVIDKSDKSRKVDYFLKLISQITLWKKYFPIGVVKSWCVKVLDVFIHVFDFHLDFECDVLLFLKLGKEVEMFMGDGYQVSKEFKPLEVSFLKNVYVRAEKVKFGGKEFYEKVLEVLQAIHSFEAAALLNSKMKNMI